MNLLTMVTYFKMSKKDDAVSIELLPLYFDKDCNMITDKQYRKEKGITLEVMLDNYFKNSDTLNKDYYEVIKNSL